jgi:hypothetical protein
MSNNTGLMLTQEFLNSMMRLPWEVDRKKSASALPCCPQCGERYCGDAVQLCTDCVAIAKAEQEK